MRRPQRVRSLVERVARRLMLFRNWYRDKFYQFTIARFRFTLQYVCVAPRAPFLLCVTVVEYVNTRHMFQRTPFLNHQITISLRLDVHRWRVANRCIPRKC